MRPEEIELINEMTMLKVEIARLKRENDAWLKLSGGVPLKLINPEKYRTLVGANAGLRERVKELEDESRAAKRRAARPNFGAMGLG